MNNTPQVETTEISDSELDNVSGGLVGEIVGSVVATADTVAPVSSTIATVQGVAASAGVDTSAVTGIVSGL